MLDGKEISEISQMQNVNVIKYLEKQKNIEESSLRQISWVTGVGVNIVFKV